MSFGTTAWLWSGLALALPILIHLLGRGRGRRELWPNIRLLRETGLASGARWRPSEPALLALRCALVATVALALAEPWLREREVGTTLWLIEPGVAKPASSSVRYLEAGLPTTDLAHHDSASPDIWSLLAEADDLFPGVSSLHVVARPRVAGLIGARPELQHAVVWTAPTAGATGATGATGEKLSPSERRVHFYIDATRSRLADANVLRQGLGSAATTIGSTVEETERPEEADVVVGLGQDPTLSGAAMRPSVLVLTDAPGELRSCPGLVSTGCCGILQRFQCGAEPAGKGLWHDGSGLRVLSRSVQGGHGVLRLATRFAPEAAHWNTAAFVSLLNEMADTSEPGLDATETSVSQATPEKRIARRAPALPGGPASGVQLANALWILAACLLAGERWLAFRTAHRRSAL
jgi:hypothetical protein